MSLTKTKIEWCDYTINPIKGLCPIDCKDNQGKSYCYARRMYKRFKWNPEIRFDREPLEEIAKIEKPSRIFVGSTIELFGEWIKWWWLKTVLVFCLLYPQHTFIFLTKQPQNLIKWSPFPRNCWLGATVTDVDSYRWAMAFLSQISAKVKFLSIEPLLSQFWLRDWEYQIPLNATLDWVITGQQTPVKKSTMPRMEWIYEIENACKKASVPYFEKDNLQSLLVRDLVQEFPQR